MSLSPPLLPISSATTTASNPAFRQFITRLIDSLRTSFSRRRPWLELIDRTQLSRPDSLSESLTRVRKNYSYFKINYMTLISSVMALSLFTHPFSLLVLMMLIAVWLFLYVFRERDVPLVVFGRVFSERETLGVLIMGTVVGVFLTNVGSLLISAGLIGVGIVCVHGAFRVPEDLFLGEEVVDSTGGGIGAGSGFLSFIGGAASSAAAAAVVPGGAARV